MEPEGSLSCLQRPTNGPYPQSDESSPQIPILFLWDPFEIKTGSRLPTPHTHTHIRKQFIVDQKFM